MNDFEATRRGAHTMDFVDLCDRCFSYVSEDIDVIEREDLEEEGYEAYGSNDIYLGDGLDNDA
jgi:hypothetical protein